MLELTVLFLVAKVRLEYSLKRKTNIKSMNGKLLGSVRDNLSTYEPVCEYFYEQFNTTSTSDLTLKQ
jgi:hypothetical protein